MSLPEGHIPHPSGGSYHPDHIQTPKEMPIAVVKQIPAPVPELKPTPSGGEAYEDVLPVGDATGPKPEIPGLVVPLERPLGSTPFVVPKLPAAEVPELPAPAPEPEVAAVEPLVIISPAADPSKPHAFGTA